MRREILTKVVPRGPGLGDHLYAVLSVLAIPAPYIVRTAVAGVLVLSLVATASVASADALPDDPLYGLKVASERVRLTLAQTPEDRAAVWLSMAEHRLAEAERLAVAGREPEALVAASAYGTQLAEAAAELASIERLEETGPTIAARLRERLADQQARAADIAERLRTGTASARSAPAFDTVASAPPAEPSGTLSELIAEHAAKVTDQVAAAAEQRAADEGVQDEVAAVPEVAAAPPAAAPAAEPPPRAVAPRKAPPAAQPQRIGSVTLPDPTTTPTETPERESGGDPNEDDERGPEDTDENDEDEGDDEEDEHDQDDGKEAEEQDKASSPKRTPTTLERLAEISKQWRAAIEKIKEQQKQAREAQKKAQERGKKTPAPAGQRSRERTDERERGDDRAKGKGRERGGEERGQDREGDED